MELLNSCITINIDAGITSPANNLETFPVHDIVIDSYKITKYLITNRQYATFLNLLNLENVRDGTYTYINAFNKMTRLKKHNDKYRVDYGFENHPVTGVTYYGAYAFALATGLRLPSEIEWENAARGGLKNKVFPWGDEQPTPLLANFGENVGKTTPVGNYPSNGFGLYDMAGNVWEWTTDWYQPTSHERKPDSRNILGIDKVIRGGGWAYPSNDLACSRRGRCWPRIGGTNIGFRLVADILKEEKIANASDVRKNFARFKV